MSLFTYAAPQRFYFLAGKLIPWFAAAALITCAIGLWLGFAVAPTDFQQGEVYRIIFIHVPSAWMAMFIYLVMSVYAVLNLGFRTRLSAMMISALAPTGALMAAIALWTGALWGKPTWGTYWAWDARMTSTLILLFLYFGYMALSNAIEDQTRADRAGSILVLVGSINVPIIYFSVYLWNTLHQGASVNPVSGSKMASVMLQAMLIMSISAWCYSVAVVLHRVRSIILVRESHTQWVQQLGKA
ncbi:MAG: heme ABC transporter permease CcmC [Lautropia sp.]|nr:heme ABC transporter permease CcmC [Lautropia sp.]